MSGSCGAKKSWGWRSVSTAERSSVGATETALHCLLLDQLMLFQQEHPDVKIRINNGTTSHVLTDLKEGRTDMAVVPTPLQIEKPYAVTKLCPVRTILVGGPRFRNLCDQSNTLGDLKQYPLAGLPASTMAHRFYENFFASHGLPLHYDIELASADLLPSGRDPQSGARLPSRRACRPGAGAGGRCFPSP